MAEHATRQTPAPAPEPKSRRLLAPAGASCDGAVQHLIAELNTAHMNSDEAAVAALTTTLTDLGYAV